MRLGVDVDGVLANFNASFIDRVVQVTGRDLFPSRPFEILCWDYPESYGYTKEETSAVWDHIVQDPDFWFLLPSYTTTMDAILHLNLQRNLGHDLYFITSRPGIRAKEQTEQWLRHQGLLNATVLISSAKGLCAKALKLDAYIDDRWENCVDVRQQSPSTRVTLFHRTWNQVYDASSRGISRQTTLPGFAGEMSVIN